MDRSGLGVHTPRQHIAVVLLLLLIVGTGIFAFLGQRGLNEPDEGRYAEMAREMVVSGDWMVPTLHGFAHLQKPPMIYWLTALSLKTFGNTEWAARLPSAAAAAGCILLVYFMGKWLFSRSAGLASAFVLTTSLEFFALSKILTPDMVMTFWITASLASFVYWTGHPEKRVWLWLFFVSMGLGFMTKGPMSYVIPISAVISWQVAMKRRGSRVSLPWGRGMAVALGVGLGWHVATALLHPELFHYFLHDELVMRYASKMHGRYHSPLFFIPVLLAGLLPWTFALPFMIPWIRRQAGRGGERVERWWLIAGWFLVPFILLSFSGSKLMTYILPLYGAVALALGAWLTDQVDRSRQILWVARWVVGLHVLLWVGVAVSCHWLPHGGMPQVLLGLTAMGLAVVGLGAALYLRKALSWAMAGATLVVWLVLSSQINLWNDSFGVQASVRPLADIVQKISPDATVFIDGVNAPGMEFYQGHVLPISKDQADHFFARTPEEQARVLNSPVDWERLKQPGQPLFGLIHERRLADCEASGKWHLLARAGHFALIQFAGKDGSEPSAAKSDHAMNDDLLEHGKTLTLSPLQKEKAFIVSH